MTKRPTALEAAALYIALTLAMTWPLVTDLAGSLPGDLGDSLLNGYILSWGEKHLVALLGGDLGAFAGWWQANIFHPAPYALAYSEHLFTEVVMALPVWVATHNVILAYNVVFLASMALSGLGMFLLVRELTESAVAAWLAGLAFAFLPYRFSQVPHLQVMSSEWMPWTIYAFRRYFATRRPAALAGALAALVAQQLACGYFLIYFTPFVAFYLVWEITARARWHDARLVATLAALLLIDAVIVWPFLFPYLELRRLGFPPRTLEELVAFSADVRGYFTAPLVNRFWGASLGMTPWPRAENELFAGGVLYLAAAMGLLEYARMRWRGAGETTAITPARRRALCALGAIGGILCVALVLIVWTGGVRTSWLSLRAADRLVLALASCMAGLLVLSPRLRSAIRMTSDLRPWAFAVVVIAWSLSLGPMPRTGGRPLDMTAPYRLLFDHVPGFDGLRVPARLAMLVSFGLAILAGYGLAAIERSRKVVPWTMAIGLAVLAETTVAPVPLNGVWSDPGMLPPPSRVEPEPRAPQVYHYLAGLPSGTVVAELPFGYTAWELRYVFYASLHQQRLLNGYSGGFPARYVQTANLLQRPLTRPDEAWQCLRANGVTTVVVHRSAYRTPAEADAVIAWLRAHGGTFVTTAAEAEVLQVPAASDSGVK
jgi:hypothetical protein